MVRKNLGSSPTEIHGRPRGTVLGWKRFVILFTAAGFLSCAHVAQRTWGPLMERVDPVKAEVRVPIYQVPSKRKDVPKIGVHLHCQGKPLFVLLDTATSLTLLRESVRNRLHLRKLGKGIRFLSPGNPTPQTEDLFLTSDLRLGGIPLQKEVVAFVEDDILDRHSRRSGIRIDGILGATILKRGEIELDIPDQILVVRPFQRSVVEESIYSVPFLYIPDANGYAIPLESGDEPVGLFLFDTGTNAALTLAEESRLGKIAKEAGTVEKAVCRTLLAEREVEVYALPCPLTLRGKVFEKGMPVYLLPRKDPRLTGTIGLPIVWSSRRVILNERRELAAFEPAEPMS